MNILLITDAYIPNANSSAVMMKDLAKELVKKGHIIYVLTTFESNIEENLKSLEVIDCVTVIRAKNLKKKNVNLIKRGISELLLPYSMFRQFINSTKVPRIDLIISYSPPITINKIISKLKRRYKCPSYLVLRDIFPQCAKDAKIIKNNFVFSFFRIIEKKLYKNSDFIGVQSMENLKYVKENNNIDSKRIEVLYNWIDPNIYNSTTSDYYYRELFGLGNKLVCLYAGNIGKYQELDFLLELAKENQNKSDLVFLIVGSGSEKERLIKKYSFLNNVVFANFISPEIYPRLVGECDIGLINLNRDLTIQNIPGKMLGYWASRIPVLASVNSGNDVVKIIEDSKGGLCSVTGDFEKYNDNFNRLYEDRILRQRYGESGHKYLLEHFSAKHACEVILNHFAEGNPV